MTRQLEHPVAAHSSAELEAAETWPVRLELLDARGVTLWSGGDKDLLLASDRRVLLFGTSWQMRHFVLSGALSNLEQRAGYRKLRSYLHGTSDRRLRIDDRAFSLNGVIASMSEGRITRGNQAQILDSLNLLWDIANTVDSTAAKRVLRAPRLRKFLDLLTFVELNGADAATEIGKFDLPRLRSDVEEAMRIVRPSIEVLSLREISVAVAG